MIRERLRQLGFTVGEEGAASEVALELLTPMLNPLTRSYIDRVAFRLEDEKLVPQAPVELVGLPALGVTELAHLRGFEDRLRDVFDECILQLQRRCSELQSLGIQPKINPSSLDLRAEIDAGPVVVELASDKQGNFRVAGARRGRQRLPPPDEAAFELSEFRDSAALQGYLEALIQDAPSRRERAEERPSLDTAVLASEDWGAAVDLVAPPPPEPVEAEVTFIAPELPEEFEVSVETAPLVHPVELPAAPVSLGELARRFGERTVIAQRSAIELVADLRVGDDAYRFAASRVAARSFRGLLAGPVGGKLWAGRFELDAFPGLVEWVSQELNVPPEQVEVTGVAVGTDD